MLRTPNHIRQAYGPGWALVGDAGYHRDAITGHGMSDAYRDAELLADALDRALRGEVGERTALAGYQHLRDLALREVFELTCALSAYPLGAGVRRAAEAARPGDGRRSQPARRPGRPGARAAVAPDHNHRPAEGAPP